LFIEEILKIYKKQEFMLKKLLVLYIYAFAVEKLDYA